MELSYKIVEKIFSKFSNNKKGLFIETFEQQKFFIDDLKKQLEAKRIEVVYFKEWIHNENQYKTSEVGLEVKLVEKKVNYWSNNFKIRFDKKKNLYANSVYRDEIYYIESINDIFLLIDEFNKQFDIADINEVKKKNNEIKREKIKDIKKNAILAKIEQISLEYNFEYTVELFVSKVKILIRLTKNDYMEIDVPFSNFQNILQQVTKAYIAVKELKDNNVPLKVKTSNQTNRIKWKTKK